MADSKKKKKTEDANKSPFSLKTVFSVALGSVVLYQIYAWTYVIVKFTAAGSGPYGRTLAVSDELSIKFPTQFVLLQKLVVLPIPNHAAEKYYESQKEIFAEAAKNFEVHPYWFTSNEAKEGMTFREVVTERIRAMHRQFQENGRMDYRLEKDRCAQFEFFRRNNIPHPEIKKTWYSHEEVLKDIESGTAVDTMEHWPVFFKACHLTQRSSLGSFAVSTKKQFDEEKEALVEWINEKWGYRSQDVDRPWQKEGDALTDELTPAIIIQEPMVESGENPHAAFKVEGRVSVGLVEIKAEVFWGRVYLMQFDATTIFHRDQGVIEEYGKGMSAVLHNPAEPDERSLWMRDEGHIDCVIELAERVAKAAHIEYIRVDMFLDRGNPKGCIVNEVSLSSGYVYYGHEQYMAKLWAGPLQRKTYKVFETNTPVYELAPDAEEEDA